jgi:hypothetical protein
MRGVWLIVSAGLIAALGCTNTPKREMRQSLGEEFPTIPAGAYTEPRAADRDQPILQPKANTPSLNTGGVPGLGGPGGSGMGMSQGPMRR